MNHTENIKESVLEKIRNAEVQMYSKTYFILKIIAFILAITGLLITSSLLISYVIFSIEVSDRLLLLGFGSRGIQTFLRLFPWHLVLIELILIIVLERIIRYFRWAYRSPLLLILFAIGLLSLCFSIFLTPPTLHERLLAQKDQLGPLGRIYNDVEKPSGTKEVLHGKVLHIQTDTLLILNLNTPRSAKPETIAVHIDKSLIKALHEGDLVFIAGEWRDGEIFAYGIRKWQPRFQINIKL